MFPTDYIFGRTGDQNTKPFLLFFVTIVSQKAIKNS